MANVNFLLEATTELSASPTPGAYVSSHTLTWRSLQGIAESTLSGILGFACE